MEHIKTNVHNQRHNFHFMILIGLVTSAIINLSRPDYNFVAYAYAYYVWQFCSDLKETQNLDKLVVFYYWIFSFFWDIFLTYKWSGIYNSIVKADYDSLLHTISFYFELSAIFIKLLNILVIAILEAGHIHSNLPKVLKEKLTNYQTQRDLNDIS
jgi:hypothetical protein